MNGNQLKLIALAAMTLDHIGVILFPQVIALRIIGRLAFPVFAYMIAEGCHYTHSKRRYALSLFVLGLVCQVVYFAVDGTLEQSIVTTLLLGALTVFALQAAVARRDLAGAAAFVGVVALDAFVCFACPLLLRHWGFSVDYGFFGVLLPTFVYTPRAFQWGSSEQARRRITLVPLTIGLVLVALGLSGSLGWVQWFSLASVVLLAFYDGTRGTLRMKWLFYVYYPLHLALIQCIAWAVG